MRASLQASFSVTTAPRDRVALTAKELDAQRVELDLLILATPTGAVRNALCDANIHLLAAIDKLRSTL